MGSVMLVVAPQEAYDISHFGRSCSSSLADYGGRVSGGFSMGFFMHCAAFLAGGACVGGGSLQQLLGVDANPVCLVTDGERTVAVAD